MSKWQAAFDPEANDYYYWNTETKETTWTKPTELNESKTSTESGSKKGKEVDEASGKVDNAVDAKAEEYYASKEYYDYYMATMQEQQIQASIAETSASFAKGQKGVGDRYASLSTDQIVLNSSQTKEHKQMSYFFDVEKYQQERALDRLKTKVKVKYTKKQLEKFKRDKIDLKRKKLIEKMGADA